MTALRSFVALAAFTASSTALAGTPVARVVQDHETGAVYAAEAAFPLPARMQTLAFVFMDAGELTVEPRQGVMYADAIYEDHDAWSLISLNGSDHAAFQSIYAPFGVMMASQDGSVTTYMDSGDVPIRMWVAAGWEEPTIFPHASGGPIVSLGEENLLGIMVDNAAGGQDIVMRSLDRASLVQVVEAAMAP